MADELTGPDTFSFLNPLSPEDVGALLVRESDRTAATVLARLNKTLAVKVLADFPRSRQQELLQLMKTARTAPEDALRMVASDLQSRLQATAAAQGAGVSMPVMPKTLTLQSIPDMVAAPAEPVEASPMPEDDTVRPFSFKRVNSLDEAAAPSRKPVAPAPKGGRAPAASGTPAARSDRASGRFAAVMDAVKRQEKAPAPSRKPARKEKAVSYGGLHIAAAILRMSGKTVRQNLKKEDPELFKQLVAHMFAFDDLAEIDDAGLQVLLAELDTHIVALSLKAASPVMRTRFLKNMSPRRSAMVDAELEAMRQVRLADIEQSQDTLLKTALSLQEKGRLLIDRDAEVV